MRTPLGLLESNARRRYTAAVRAEFYHERECPHWDYENEYPSTCRDCVELHEETLRAAAYVTKLGKR